MDRLSALELARMCGGTIGKNFAAEGWVDDVVIDSRKAGRNCLFVAIKGENADGHEFVAKVVAEPSNFALVAEGFSANLPNLIRVKDTTKALGNLASSYRQKFDIPLVAITGSNGKTTLKEMLRSVCNKEFGESRVLATSGNLNNHLGMPLTLLELNHQHKVAVIEMGMNHAGELTYLSKLARPTLAVVNNVMFAHAGFFKSIDEIAAAKGEIYSGLDRHGLACIDAGSLFGKGWADAMRKRSVAVFSYGSPDSGCYIKELMVDQAKYVTPHGEVDIRLQVLGQHNYLNALTVIALAINIGCSLDSIKEGLECFSGYKRRLERKTAFNGALVIDDSYNANPDSVKAALSAIQVLPKPYWFIFADLKELGEFEWDFHHKLGQEMNNYGISKLLTVGELAAHAANCFEGDKIHFANNQDIVQYCLINLPQNATVLVKGSLSMNLAEVVAGIVKQG